MKIGVMTFWQSHDNYGQLLQSWALQQYLKNNGHSPYLIRYKRWHPRLSHSPAGYAKHVCRELLSQLNLVKGRLTGTARDFDRFRKEQIEMSSDITGSDQVWNFAMHPDDFKAYFLRFGSKDTNRISYAASFGFSYITDEAKPLFDEYLPYRHLHFWSRC